MIGILQSPHPHAFAVRSFANVAHLLTADPRLSLRIEDAYARNPPAHAIPLPDSEEQLAMERAQASTRAGTVILVSLQRPYLLDFRRNEVWSAGNFGGSASPPPGFPIDGTGEQIASYLRAVGVDYVLFQYAGREVWFDEQLQAVAAREFENNPWNDSAVQVSVRFRGALRRLMVFAGSRFQDDRFVVIKVGTP